MLFIIQSEVMGVVGGKLRQGFEDWRVLTEDADIKADANHVELYVKAGFIKGAAMLLEKITIAMNMELYKKSINQMNKRLDVANYIFAQYLINFAVANC